MENTKNKNTPLSLNKFFVFFVFKNRKQEPNKPLVICIFSDWVRGYIDDHSMTMIDL